MARATSAGTSGVSDGDPVTAARLYADALIADPKVADALKTSHRYNAACSAALAAAGQGSDVDKLNDQERGRLRQQALAWLRGDVEQWATASKGGRPADRQVMRAALEHWQHDTDLAAQRLLRHGAHVVAVHQHGTLLHVVEA